MIRVHLAYCYTRIICSVLFLIVFCLTTRLGWAPCVRIHSFFCVWVSVCFPCKLWREYFRIY